VSHGETEFEALVGDRYRLTEMLGQGGMGAVYRATDVSTGREVALKRLLEGRKAEKRAQLRFEREFHTLASLRHPRIVEAYDYGRDRSGAFYTMELLLGDDLRQMSPLGPAEACRVLRDVASALAFLHARGLIHRDLKPRNVRATASGVVKLIDFGVLTAVGATTELAGTPNYTAPESVYGQPLDGRTDLYALGAVGYVLLTTRSPYAATGFSSLPEVWREPLPPPSTFASDISPALDDLILQLLSLNPLGRPPSAAVVVDLLTAIGGLEREPSIELGRGYLASAAMVGRRREMVQLRAGIEHATHGGNAVATIEAESGTGKSRVLRELALEAKLAGAVVAVAGAERTSGVPYGVVGDLLGELCNAHPNLLRAAPPATVGTLARVFQALRERLGGPEPIVQAADPGEERMRVQSAIGSWLRTIATTQMLVLLVDDVQHADEASMAVLAALARDESARGIYIVVARRLGEPVRAEQAVSLLRQVAQPLSLRGLVENEVLDLVRSYFGDAEHCTRLAAFMHRVSEGSPLLCSELARHLVETNIVRYEDGEWLLPAEFSEKHVPLGLGAAIQRRLDHLGPTVRQVGEVLAVHGGHIALDTAVALVSKEPVAVFAALDELVRHGVLLEANGMFRFRHDQLREGLLRRIGTQRMPLLHRRVGDRILAEGADEAREAEVGWHLVAGGDRPRGGEMLQRAGTRLFDTQALSDCLAPLEAALEVLVETGAPRHRQMPVLFMLLAAGWVANRKIGAKYAMTAVVMYRDAAGIGLADKLGRHLGRHVGLLLALVLACLRWIVTGFRGLSPIKALISFPVALGYACALAYAANRRSDVLELVRLVEPLDAFHSRLPFAAYLGMHAFPAIMDGRLGEAESFIERALALLEQDKLTPATEAERHFIEVGLRGLLVISYVNQFDPRLDEQLQRIEALEFRYYHLVAQTARIVRHRYRGEEDKAREIERATEASSLQLGSWSTELQRLLFAHPAYALTHDLSGLKRCADELTAYIDEGFRFEARAALTAAERLRERRQYDQARALIAGVAGSIKPHDFLMRQWLGSTVAATELEAGAPEVALKRAEEVIALGKSEAHGIFLTRLRCERIAGVALVELGRAEDGKRRLLAALELAELRECNALAGHLHESLARVAHAAGDRLSYEVHTARAGTWLLATNNPYLVAVHERLVRLGRDDAGEPAAEAASGSTTGDDDTVEMPKGVRRGQDSDSATQRDGK